MASATSRASRLACHSGTLNKHSQATTDLDHDIAIEVFANSAVAEQTITASFDEHEVAFQTTTQLY